MGEIEIGEYIRTKKGYLGKYQKSVEGFDEFTDSEGTFMLDIEDIVKHSKNIIDLIEVGDYVNGELITSIYDENKEDEQIQIEVNNQGNYTYYINEDIKTIVTKQQFSQMEYRLED